VISFCQSIILKIQNAAVMTSTTTFICISVANGAAMALLQTGNQDGGFLSLIGVTEETNGLNVGGHYRKIMDLSTADKYFLYAQLTNQYNFHAVIPRVPSLQVMGYHM